MAHEIRIPRLGWSMEEGTFVRWLRQDGEEVRAGDVLYELESDKATQEIESMDAGILRIPADAPAPGDVVPVGALLGYLTACDEDAPLATRPASDRPSAGSEQPAQPAIAARPDAAPIPAPRQSSPIAQAPAARHIASPRARRVAKELGVDWKQLSGSGRNGRVRERDVRQAARGTTIAASPASNHEEAMPVSSRRRTIAARMLASAKNTAPVTLTTRLDATNLVSLRRQFKAAISVDSPPSYTDIILCLTVAALKKHALLAGRWEEDRIVLPADDGFHIAIAVDTDEGLLAPVLRNVAPAGLLEVAARSRDLIERARRGRLSPAELHGGVFTVTNLGAYGIDAFTPIINYPETAILGMGAIRREPAVTDDDRVVPRDVMTLSLTFDHRAVDGAPAARFLRDLAAAIVNPSATLLALR